MVLEYYFGVVRNHIFILYLIQIVLIETDFVYIEIKDVDHNVGNGLDFITVFMCLAFDETYI